jgi:small subunit ribosomal protein S20
MVWQPRLIVGGTKPVSSNQDFQPMPNTKSAKKRLRQNAKVRSANRAKRSSLRGQIRKVREAVAGGDVAQSEAEFKTAAKMLDRAGAHRLIHPNVAARTKARLSAAIKNAKSSPA